MKIRIRYELYTDGDYTLNYPEEFGCWLKDDGCLPYYLGEMFFEDQDINTCKAAAISFLQRLLHDGIHVSETHRHLCEHLLRIITELTDFIRENHTGPCFRNLSGNYDGTVILVDILG